MEQQTQSIHVSTFGLLGILFVALKLCGVISWSWWWVTAPFWGPVVLGVTILTFTFFAAIAVALFKHILDK